MLRDIQLISEDAMIATFLQGEIASPRYGLTIRELLRAESVGEEVIAQPNTFDDGANRFRRSVLARYRGYGLDVALFHGFPKDVAWHRAKASVADLRTVRYINYDYWNSLSGGSRLAEDGARRVRERGQDDAPFKLIVDAVRSGATLPELILVARSDWTGLVVLEGHTRLTAYLLEPSVIPPSLGVVVGCSPNIAGWRLY